MRRDRTVAFADITLICFLCLFLLLLVFVSFQSQYAAEAIVIFCVELVILLIVYFNPSLVLGLVLSGTMVLVYGGYTLYFSLVRGIVPDRLYFFLLWIPLITWSFWAFIVRTGELAMENSKLRADLEKTYRTVDQETGLPNLRAYTMTVPGYMSLIQRHKLGLYLVTVKVVPSQPQRAVSQEDLRGLTAAFEEILRTEDEIFLVSRAPYTYALMLLRKKEGAYDLVLERLKRVNPPDGLRLEYGSTTYKHTDDAEINAQQLLTQAQAHEGDLAFEWRGWWDAEE